MLLIVCRCMPSPRRRRRQQRLRRRLFRALIDISTCLVVSYELSLYVWYCVVLGTLHLYVLLLLLLLWWRSDARPWRFVGWLVDAFEEEQRDGYVVAISSYHLYPQTYYRVLGLLVLPPAIVYVAEELISIYLQQLHSMLLLCCSLGKRAMRFVRWMVALVVVVMMDRDFISLDVFGTHHE